MASLLTLKRRIKTTSNISKTTKAFQMIAASRLKKAQNAAEASQPYVQKLDNISKNLAQKIEDTQMHEYMKINPQTNDKLLIVISPDKGLCGGLITNLIREVLHYSTNGKIYYITIGKKAETTIASLNKNIVASFPFGTSLPEFDIVYPVAKLVNEYFLGKKVSEVKILSTKFNSVFTQSPGLSNLLPVVLDTDETKEKVSTSVVTLFEPNVEKLLPDLLQHYLEMVIYQSLLESYASEQASRMIAMKNATDNALDMISELQLEYNKSRQEKITNELLDIGGGAIGESI